MHCNLHVTSCQLSPFCAIEFITINLTRQTEQEQDKQNKNNLI
nr:MAG TPA: hypothetical protein [Caudoviricetes sp.]